MKLKLTLQRPAGPADLMVTVESGTAVGDLARRLVLTDPARRDDWPTGDLTLSVAGTPAMTLDGAQLLADSGLRSGAAVSIIQSSQRYADPQRPAVAVVRVLDGPDSGREFQIPSGSSIIGRERGCEVRLTDVMISRRHARINIGDTVEIVDLGSANGVVIDEVAVPRSVLRAADVVQLGDTRLSVRLLGTSDRGDRPRAGTSVEFVRSPRLDPVFEQRSLEAPEPPERQRAQRFPALALLAPVLMGALLYLMTKSLTSLVFVALSPLMLLGNAFESRLAGRSAYKRAVAEWREDVASLITDLEQSAQLEQAMRDAECPSTPRCLRALSEYDSLLWTRRPGERGFAELRLGTSRLPSRTTVELPRASRSARALLAELREALAPCGGVEPVPVVGALGTSAIGVGGPRALYLPVARGLIVQLIALHSPAELALCALVSTHSAVDWDWLKWLPHTSSPHSPIKARHLVSSSTGGAQLLSELEDLLAQRSDAGNDVQQIPAIVVLVEGDAPVEHSRLVSIAERGAAFGVHVIWLAAELAMLPAACATYLELTRDGLTGTAGFVHTATSVSPLTLEPVDENTASAVGRQLAAVVDVGARTEDASDLPRSVSLLTLNGPELASVPEAVLERWSENRSILTGPFAPNTPPRHAGSLRAVIGQSAGEYHALDLRADGPHALVGGTTGSGKSELLQAWILAMASAHSPQRLTFLLVDYKGGAAFKECKDLPHTVGLVTDLSQHLVRRALTSLSAELRYREEVLRQHAAKDLVELEKKGVVDAPPALVIVVDEFAALVTEVPEFVDGVVNVAQRGRSLGLHLILATQRPAGVIKDNLRANTNLRLALRMADEADSTDVLGSPQAAFFDPSIPGRAVSKTGPGRLMPFQSGYAGGWTTDEPPPPEISIEELSFGASVVWEAPESVEVAPADPGPSDIKRLVESVARAGELAEIPRPRIPWLPELRPVYDLADQAEVRSRRTDTELVFGIRDDPDNQAQPTVAFYPDRDGNLAVYGTGGSGKSTLLRTLAIAAGFTVRGGPCHVYGIDFGARGLSMLEELPHVGSVIAGGDHERITRLLGWIRTLIDERALRYSRAKAGTITDYRRIADAPDEPRILVLVDGIAAFRQAYESTDRVRWFDMFTSIAADGRPVGVHVIVSSDQRNGMTTSLSSAVQARVVLRLAVADDYGALGVPADILSPSSPSGRGIVSGAEVQVAVLGGTADVLEQSAAIRGFGESMRRAGASQAPAIRSLPESVSLDELAAQSEEPVIGIRGSDLQIATFEPSGTFLVAGPPGSGRSTTLLTVHQTLLRSRPGMRQYLLGSRRSGLAPLSSWTSRAIGEPEIAELAVKLCAELDGAVERAGVALFIEAVSDLQNGPADAPLQDLLRICAAAGDFVVAEGEASGMSGSFGLLGAVKAGRSGIALAPDPADGNAIFRTNFPRINRNEFPPGRALHVRHGRAEVVQIALPTGG